MPFRSKIQKAYLYALKIGRIPVLILIVGFLLAVLVFQFLLQYQVEHAEKEFYDIADRVYQSSSIELRKHTQIVYSVGNILGQIENLTEEEFSNISNLFINTTHFEQFHYYKWKNVSDEGGKDAQWRKRYSLIPAFLPPYMECKVLKILPRLLKFQEEMDFFLYLSLLKEIIVIIPSI